MRSLPGLVRVESARLQIFNLINSCNILASFREHLADHHQDAGGRRHPERYLPLAFQGVTPYLFFSANIFLKETI